MEPSGPLWRAPPPRPRAEYAPRSYVIVGCDRADRALLRASLRARRMRVACFDDVFEAAAMLSGVVPDAILVELRHDALSFARALRADPATARTALVGLRTDRAPPPGFTDAGFDLIISVRRALVDVEPLCACADQAAR